jgi:hypothetical protein
VSQISLAAQRPFSENPPSSKVPSLSTGIPVDAVTGIGTKRTEWQAHLGSIGRREESHGVNPETRNGYKEGLVAVISTAFPQLWKCLAWAFSLS